MERANREVWAKRVERWQDSGLTAKEFAAELDVSANSLTFWRWKLRQPQS
jgi:transposase